MTSGSWPYLPEQCPGCFYFEPASPPFVDDSGYEILCFLLPPAHRHGAIPAAEARPVEGRSLSTVRPPSAETRRQRLTGLL